MEENSTKDYLLMELDQEAITRTRSEGDYMDAISIEDQEINACWGIKILEICVKSVSSDKVVLVINFSGAQVARITLTKKKTCAKFKKSVGGDLARVDVTVCVDFTKKEIRASGRVCASFACTKFNQKILSW